MTQIQTRYGRRFFTLLFATILSLGMLLPFGQNIPVAYAQLTCNEPHIWVSDGFNANGNRIERFDYANSLAFHSFLNLGGILSDPHDIKVGPDGNLYIANTTTTGGTGSVIQYNPTTNTTATVANVPNPFGLTFGPNGNIYVTGGGGTAGGNQVYEIDMSGAPGSFPIAPSTFVATTDGTNYRINRAHEGIEFGSDGSLYVVSNLGAAGPPASHHGVLRFDASGATAVFQNIVLTLNPIAPTYNLRDLAFDAAGNLYITQIEPTTSAAGTISRYSMLAGVGTLDFTFAAPPDFTNRPVGMAFAPDGELYVVHRDRRINRYNPDTGAFLGDFGTAELDNPKALALTHCLDLGDLPDAYGTTLANNGPRHVTTENLYLGQCVDAEADGQPSPLATGDDSGAPQAGTTILGTICADDEDGVQVCPGLGGSEAGNALGWSDGTVEDTLGGCLQLSITGNGIPQIFIDFNGDNTLSSVTLRNSDNSLITGSQTGLVTAYFDIPAGTFPGTGANVGLAVRARLSTAGGLGPTGFAPDGEVEDYIFPFSPTAVSLSQNPTATPMSSTTLPIIAFLLTGFTLLLLWRRPQVQTD